MICNIPLRFHLASTPKHLATGVTLDLTATSQLISNEGTENLKGFNQEMQRLQRDHEQFLRDSTVERSLEAVFGADEHLLSTLQVSKRKP